jgi:hypothetical protein
MTKEELERLSPALDRLQEAHFWLHGLEAHYHNADPFRWHLNAFLRAIKEIPQLISMGLQNRIGFAAWFRPHRDALSSDPLIQKLAKDRDLVVHQGMLMPRSSAAIGITEGRGMKLGIGMPVSPFTDSDDAMQSYLKGKDILDILMDDEDSIPCVERHWRLDAFGDEDIVDVCAKAWLRTASVLTNVLTELGGPEFAPDLSCRHELDHIRFRVYDRGILRRGRVEGYFLNLGDA